jgi:hypothetical protein
MRKNRTAYFLVISFAILSLVFYKLLPKDSKEGEKEKEDTELTGNNNSIEEEKKEQTEVNAKSGTEKAENSGRQNSTKVESNSSNDNSSEVYESESSKEKKEMPVNINTGFKRITGQNRVEWSKTLAENAVSIRIVYTVKGVGVLVDEMVSGRNFHIYDPGTSRAHGRSTKVELIVDYGDKKVNETGALVIDNQFFVCSAN